MISKLLIRLFYLPSRAAPMVIHLKINIILNKKQLRRDP